MLFGMKNYKSPNEQSETHVAVIPFGLDLNRNFDFNSGGEFNNVNNLDFDTEFCVVNN